MTVNVCITIDTEFTIGGAFSDPRINVPVSLPSVYCDINGKSHGLGYILDTLSLFNLQATFFLEALNVCYFGDDPLARVAKDILEKGQDIQLHLHPCWQLFKEKNWAEMLRDTPPADTLVGASRSKSIEVIETGIKILERIGCPKPSALRMGNLFVDKNIYHAMNNLGLNVSSNIGLGVSMPKDTDLHLYGGQKILAGVLEVPVTTYRDLKIGRYQHNKCLTIIGTSFYEMKAILNIAYEKGIKTIVVLTHPSEFVIKQDFSYKDIRPNKLTMARLKKLCEYLDLNRDKYKTVNFSQVSKSLNEEEDNCIIGVPMPSIAIRYLENKLWNKIMEIK